MAYKPQGFVRGDLGRILETRQRTKQEVGVDLEGSPPGEHGCEHGRGMDAAHRESNGNEQQRTMRFLCEHGCELRTRAGCPPASMDASSERGQDARTNGGKDVICCVGTHTLTTYANATNDISSGRS